MPARGIPDARFVALEGTNHLILSHDSPRDVALDAL